MKAFSYRITEKLKSRKFWFAVVAAGVSIANVVLDLNLRAEDVFGIVSPLLAFIFAEAYVDANR